jgi:hypothetical protein
MLLRIRKLLGSNLSLKISYFDSRFGSLMDMCLGGVSLNILQPLNYIFPDNLFILTHLRLGLPSGLFPSGFPTNILYALPFVLHAQPISSFLGTNILKFIMILSEWLGYEVLELCNNVMLFLLRNVKYSNLLIWLSLFISCSTPLLSFQSRKRDIHRFIWTLYNIK